MNKLRKHQGISAINTHRLNMLIDFLIGSRKNQRLLWRIGAILLVIQLPIVVYLAAFITPSGYPAWWQVIVDWGLQHIPAAQGWTNRTFTHREQMPAIYMVWFIFSVPTAIFAILLTEQSEFPSFSFTEKGIARGVFDTLIVLSASILGFWFFYLHSENTPITEPGVRFAALVESIPGLLCWTIGFCGFSALIVITPMVFVRLKIGRILKNYMAKREKYCA